MSKKIDHAKHNESVCNFISHKQDFADWVVTTAFYSAIHFVDHKIFPKSVSTSDGKKFKVKCIDEYRNITSPTKERHAVRNDLVKSELSEISYKFHWLYSTCRTARYINFEFPEPRAVSQMAKEYLQYIKGICDSK